MVASIRVDRLSIAENGFISLFIDRQVYKCSTLVSKFGFIRSAGHGMAHCEVSFR